MSFCKEEVLDDIPSDLLLFLGSVCIDHVEVAVVASCNVLDSILEHWIWNDHPLAAVVEVRIVGKDSCFLIEAGVAHSDVAVVLVEELSCCCEGRVTKVIF